MVCPNCGEPSPDAAAECARCGVVFARWRGASRDPTRKQGRGRDAFASGPAVRPGPRPGPGQPAGQAASASLARDLALLLRERSFDVRPGTHPLVIAGRGLVWLLLVAWGFGFATHPLDGGYVARSFLHLINLVFHEAGHVVFAPFGAFLTSLGGSLLQVLVPLACLAAFLFQSREPFGASFGLWWAGQNLCDLAPYVADARALDLVLLGGATGKEVEGHDWEAILGRLGWLQHDVALGRLAHAAGVLVMLLGLVWGAWLLREQWRTREGSGSPS